MVGVTVVCLDWRESPVVVGRTVAVIVGVKVGVELISGTTSRGFAVPVAGLFVGVIRETLVGVTVGVRDAPVGWLPDMVIEAWGSTVETVSREVQAVEN